MSDVKRLEQEVEDALCAYTIAVRQEMAVTITPRELQASRDHLNERIVILGQMRTLQGISLGWEQHERSLSPHPDPTGEIPEFVPANDVERALLDRIAAVESDRSRLLIALEEAQRDAEERRQLLVMVNASCRLRGEKIKALTAASVLQKEEQKWLSENLHHIRAEGGGYHYYVRPWITYRGYNSLDDLVTAERANSPTSRA